jgi:hypothetical protein
LATNIGTGSLHKIKATAALHKLLNMGALCVVEKSATQKDNTKNEI